MVYFDMASISGYSPLPAADGSALAGMHNRAKVKLWLELS